MAIVTTDSTVEVFFSYSHKDEALRAELDKHLASLKRQRVIKAWHDRQIPSGAKWRTEIDQYLNSADLILLLISSDFLSSDFCYCDEMNRALERNTKGEAQVIPIIIRPVVWQEEPISKLQALPEDGKPVTTWEDRDKAWVCVVQGIKIVIDGMAKKKATINREAFLLSSLPRPPHIGFVKRRDRDGHDLLDRLREELSPQRQQLVTLWGPGGVGKTTLACEAVRALVGVFAGRVVWTGPQQRAEFTLIKLLDEIATQLDQADLRQLAPEQKRVNVRNLIAYSPTLIVLDNFETIDSQEQFRCIEWLMDAPCSILITTRDKIDSTRNISVSVMLPEEAMEVLVRLTEQVHDPDSFVDIDRNLIIKTAECNPLVLEWITAQIDEAQDTVTTLEELKQGEGNIAARIFDRSFDLPQLGDDGRAALLALSLFVPSASRPSLANVAGFGNDTKLLNRAVKRLARLWLVRAKEGNLRLTVEGLTKELTRARLAKDSRSNGFYRRFVAHFLSYVDSHALGSPEDLDALENEKDNVVSALDMAFRLNEWLSVIKMASLLAEPINGLLSIHGYWDEAFRCNAQGLEAANKSGDEVQVARFKHNMGVIYHKRGEFLASRRCQEDSLEIARGLNDQNGIARALHQLGNLALEEKDWLKSRQLYAESLEIEKGLNDLQGVSRTLRQLGNCAYLQEELLEALEFYTESLQIGEKIGDQRGLANTLHELGNLSQKQGGFVKAFQLYNDSLTIARRLGYQSCIGRTLHQMGLVVEKEGDSEKALQIIQEAIDILAKLGSRFLSVAKDDLRRIKSNISR